MYGGTVLYGGVRYAVTVSVSCRMCRLSCVDCRIVYRTVPCTVISMSSYGILLTPLNPRRHNAPLTYHVHSTVRLLNAKFVCLFGLCLLSVYRFRFLALAYCISISDSTLPYPTYAYYIY